MKHLLVGDTTQRLGCMSGGVNDIKEHKWFKDDFSWDSIMTKAAKPPFIPIVKDEGDTENFSTYPDSPEPPELLSPADDPFKDW